MHRLSLVFSASIALVACSLATTNVGAQHDWPHAAAPVAEHADYVTPALPADVAQHWYDVKYRTAPDINLIVLTS